MSEVTVIIPAFNAGKYLEECIKSVREQTFPDWSCIIYDDGSTDNTLEIANRAALEDDRFFIISQSNHGTPKTVSFAYSQVSTKYFCQVDADDKISPTAISTLYNTLEACSEDIGVAYSDYLRMNEDGSPDYNDPHFKSRCLQIFSLRRMQNRGFCAFQFRLIRTAAYQLALPVSADVPVGEDFDLVMKLAEVCQFVHIPQKLYYYRQHQSQTSRQSSGLLEATCRTIMQDSKKRSSTPDHIVLLHYRTSRDLYALRAWLSANTAHVLMIVVVGDPLDPDLLECKEYTHHRMEIIPRSDGDIDYNYLASRMVSGVPVIEFEECFVPTGGAIDDLLSDMSIPVMDVEPRTTWMLQAGLVRLLALDLIGSNSIEFVGSGPKSDCCFYRLNREDFNNDV